MVVKSGRERVGKRTGPFETHHPTTYCYQGEFDDDGRATGN